MVDLWSFGLWLFQFFSVKENIAAELDPYQDLLE
jgi:hypothetical protein